MSSEDGKSTKKVKVFKGASTGGKWQSTASNFRMIARVNNFMFARGPTKAKVGGNDETN